VADRKRESSTALDALDLLGSIENLVVNADRRTRTGRASDFFLCHFVPFIGFNTSYMASFLIARILLRFILLHPSGLAWN
jgi:hypothetical protein